MAHLRLLAALAAIAPAAAAAAPLKEDPVPWAPVPRVTIDLDLPPANRFDAAVAQFNASAWAVWALFEDHAALRDALYAVVDARGPEPDEMQQEVEGLAATSKLPVKFVQGVQALYELQTLMVPIVNFSKADNMSFAPEPLPEKYAALADLPWRGPGCTGIVALNSEDGTVAHARNQDFSPIPLFRPLVYEGVFKRNGSELFRSEMLAGYVGILTGYRPGSDGYVIERNTRYTDHKGGNREMLQNLLDGRALAGWSFRKILEDESTYDEAFARVSSVPIVATEYAIMSGVGKGHVIARSPDGVAHLQTLGVAGGGEPADYVIITNFDFFWGDVREWFDPTGGKIGHPRRIAAQKLLNATLAAGEPLTPAVLNATINADGVLADTIFQAVANVEKGVWDVAKPAVP
mmetsp:Transcript_4246/g.13321  ORF Transcript_4246/g.13321 Transcript_4246/m.13321 type:complete len:405 (+) Transcript_4246:137-1351(+)